MECFVEATSLGGACEQEAAACFYGELSCGEVVDCLEACQGDESCNEACSSSMSMVGKSYWDAVMICAGEACSTECTENPESEECGGCFFENFINALFMGTGPCADQGKECKDN